MPNRGITITHIIAILVCVVILVAVLAVVIPSAMNKSRSRKDQFQLRGIAVTFTLYAEVDKYNYFPLPSYINSVPDDSNPLGTQLMHEFGDGVVLVERGRPDESVNLSGWIHSYMIGTNYYDSQNLISANETNPIVVAKGDQKTNNSEIPYDYDAASDFANDSYWDPLFSGDISGQGRAEGTVEGGVEGVCHTSYANMALCGERLKYWKSGDHRRVVMSSRGPENGASVGDDYTKSPTLQFYGNSSKWEGIYVTADCSTHYSVSPSFGNHYTPLGKTTALPDNLFSAEFTDYENTNSFGNKGGASNDAWMVLNVASTDTDVKTVWDKFLP